MIIVNGQRFLSKKLVDDMQQKRNFPENQGDFSDGQILQNMPFVSKTFDERTHQAVRRSHPLNLNGVKQMEEGDPIDEFEEFRKQSLSRRSQFSSRNSLRLRNAEKAKIGDVIINPSMKLSTRRSLSSNRNSRRAFANEANAD